MFKTGCFDTFKAQCKMKDKRHPHYFSEIWIAHRRQAIGFMKHRAFLVCGPRQTATQTHTRYIQAFFLKKQNKTVIWINKYVAGNVGQNQDDACLEYTGAYSGYVHAGASSILASKHRLVFTHKSDVLQCLLQPLAQFIHPLLYFRGQVNYEQQI